MRMKNDGSRKIRLPVRKIFGFLGMEAVLLCVSFFMLAFAEKLPSEERKLQVEEKDLEIAGILADWVGYIRELCQEDPEMARAVRRKNKELKYCMTGLIAAAFSCKVHVSEKIVKETYVMHNGKKENRRTKSI